MCAQKCVDRCQNLLGIDCKCDSYEKQQQQQQTKKSRLSGSVVNQPNHEEKKERHRDWTVFIVSSLRAFVEGGDVG